MSVEALAFAKRTELDGAESDGARLLFYVIAENTLNDTCLCKVGQAELRYQTRGSLRSIQRRIAAMEAEGKIKVARQGGEGKGRKPDHIEIVGFREWLKAQRSQKQNVSQPPENGQPAKLASCQNSTEQPAKSEGGNPPNSKGQPANSGGYSKNRTSTTRTSTPPLPPSGGMSEDLKIASKGSGATPSTTDRPRTNAMNCAISSEARNEARRLADGWDLHELETEWREWNAAQDNVVRDPDKAFVEFCRKRGPHKAARKLKLAAPVPAEYRDRVLKPEQGEIIIDRLGPHWQAWMDHLHRVSPDTAKLAGKSFAMAVTSARPVANSPTPRVQIMPAARS